MGSTNLPDDAGRPDPRRELPDPEAALGGADDVPKTTYVTGQGTDPNARKTDDAPNASVSAGGLGIGGWILIAIVAAIALLFGGGLLGQAAGDRDDRRDAGRSTPVARPAPASPGPARYSLGSVTPTWPWYLPFLSL